ncbi:L,D-transpeptidase catalytic domain [Amphritea atlantica]|uniref:L,D-transpeptidase catalytic domain n=1 Tax=Amphritea atlantica TaxID=355243 RepID=A0A1H9I1J5_9GAMM|nr:L,D-transpeptidase [Amphritea atlantica]SEQ68500.1 L,D-transpeptidase catalytic domain [Amphritea atlantica]
MFIRISIIHQRLEVWQDAECVVDYPVSTALNGPGEQKNSGCTPRGKHLVRAKIGAGKPLNTVFVGRRDTGETYSADLARRYPQRDWILTRILWLSGCEIGRNRLSSVDTMQRYIYIHGTPDSEPMGQPLSHGCIRMRNNDIAELFERVSVGTLVFIE